MNDEELLCHVFSSLGIWEYNQKGSTFRCRWRTKQHDVYVDDYAPYPVSTILVWMRTWGDTVNGMSIDELREQYNSEIPGIDLNELL